MRSNKGREWFKFSEEVEDHIEHYVVPQYGDSPHDMAEDFTIEEMKSQLKRYVGRIGSGARGPAEAQRDLRKIAHYACMLAKKLPGGYQWVKSK